MSIMYDQNSKYISKENWTYFAVLSQSAIPMLDDDDDAYTAAFWFECRAKECF